MTNDTTKLAKAIVKLEQKVDANRLVLLAIVTALNDAGVIELEAVKRIGEDISQMLADQSLDALEPRFRTSLLATLAEVPRQPNRG